jgi:hypothetical protein
VQASTNNVNKTRTLLQTVVKDDNKLNNLRQKINDLNIGQQFRTCMAITEYATPKQYSLKRDTEGNFKSVIKINHILSSASVFAGSVLLNF